MKRKEEIPNREIKKKEFSNNMTENMQRLCKGFSPYAHESWDFSSE